MRLLLPLLLVACASSTPRPVLDGSPACDAPAIDLLGPDQPSDDLLLGLPEVDPQPLATRDHPVLVPDAGLYPIPHGVIALRCGERDGGEPDNDCEIVIGTADGRALWTLGLYSDAESTATVETFALSFPSLLDVTGDGRPELVLSWHIMSEPYPAVGPQATEHLAILTAPSPASQPLTTLYGPVPTRANGAGGLDYCEATLALRVCDGRPVIDRARRCQAAICVDADAETVRDLGCGWKPDITRAVWNGKRFE